MDSKSSLLDQLRIDRGAVVPARRQWPWWTAAALLAAGVGAVAWFAFATENPPAREVTEQPAPTPVAAAPVVPAPATGRPSILDASGYVVARRQATVSSKITARVVAVLIEEGQQVERGEIIAYLDDANAAAATQHAKAQLMQAQASLEAARVAFVNERRTFQRYEAQFTGGQVTDISAQEFDMAKARFDAARMQVNVAARAVEVAEAALGVAERNLADTEVRAPFAGVVTVKAAQEGEMVSPLSAGGGFTRTGIGTIVDMGSLEVEVDINENFINRVRPGQPVAVQLNAYPEWSIPGSVVAIIPTADRSRATVRVRVRLEERDERVLSEMGVRVTFLNHGSGRAERGTAVED